MRNEIVDEIVRAERIAGTLLSTAKQNANVSIQKTNLSIQDTQRKAVESNKKLYKNLLVEQENEAKEEYDKTISLCKEECELFKKKSEKNILKVAKLISDEVKKWLLKWQNLILSV